MMRKQKLLTAIAFFAMIGILFNACKKNDDPTPITGEALFEYVVNGYEITFTNTSTITGSTFTYAWDFGDSKGTSTEENPVYVYDTKGEYTVTLTVTDEQGGTHPIATSIVVAKASPVKLDDNSFADWDGVKGEGFEVHFSDTIANIVKEAKFDFDANMVYGYIKYEGVDSVWFDAFMDNDNDTLTGSRNWVWPNTGSEYLIEGQFAKEGGAEVSSSFYFTGATQDAWSWADDKPFKEGYLTVGTITNSGGTVMLEFGLARDKVTDLDNDVVQIGIMLSDPVTWGDIGYVPDPGAAGFTIDMK